ncbi:hypothetical protein IV102_03545 [bacterium]|nr:hypothetical protein [bacterium]
MSPLKICLVLLAASSLLATCAVPMSGLDTDFFWHLAGGRYMAQTGQILTHDVFSHTRFESDWDNRDWLFQCMVYGAYRMGGFNAAVGLRVAFIMLSLGVLALAGRRRGAGTISTALAVLWAGSLAANYPNVRPYFISLFCGSAMVYALEGLRLQPDPRRNWRSALIVWAALWFWSNNHGGVSLVGLDMVGVYALLGVAWQRQPWRAWALIVVGSVVALMAVPQPLETLSFVINMTLGNNPYKYMMVEFFPPNFWAPHERPYGLFIVFFVVGALMRALGQRQPLDLVLFISFSPLLFTGGRHQFLLLPLLAPAMATMLSDVGRGLPKPGPRAVLALCFLCLLGSVRECMVALRLGWPPRRLVSWDELPEGACNWLLAQNIHGNMFNDMPWGGYLMWRLGPQSRVFMDARNEVYGYGQVLQDFLKVIKGDEASALALLDQYKVDFAVVESQPGRLNGLLRGSAGWVKAFDDGVGAVYLRSHTQNTWKKYVPHWTEVRNRAAGLAVAPAIATLQEALQAYPDSPSMRVQLGVLLAPQQPTLAEREWRLALLAGPVPLAHYNLGLTARNRGDYLRAACEFGREWDLFKQQQAADQLAKLAPAPLLYSWAYGTWTDFWAPLTVW